MRGVIWSAVSGFALTGAPCATEAQFSGPYAPANWTFDANGGSGSVNTALAPVSIALVGNDNGVGGIRTDYSITAPASGFWSFDWLFIPMDTGTNDSGYYLLNGVQHLLAYNIPPPPKSGSVVGVPVNVGDIIGFRVFSGDGVFGAGTLVISNFSAPIPGPDGLAVVLAPALWIGLRRRRAGS